MRKVFTKVRCNQEGVHEALVHGLGMVFPRVSDGSFPGAHLQLNRGAANRSTVFLITLLTDLTMMVFWFAPLFLLLTPNLQVSTTSPACQYQPMISNPC